MNALPATTEPGKNWGWVSALWQRWGTCLLACFHVCGKPDLPSEWWVYASIAPQWCLWNPSRIEEFTKPFTVQAEGQKSHEVWKIEKVQFSSGIISHEWGNVGVVVKDEAGKHSALKLEAHSACGIVRLLQWEVLPGKELWRLSMNSIAANCSLSTSEPFSCLFPVRVQLQYVS